MQPWFKSCFFSLILCLLLTDFSICWQCEYWNQEFLRQMPPNIFLWSSKQSCPRNPVSSLFLNAHFPVIVQFQCDCNGFALLLLGQVSFKFLLSWKKMGRCILYFFPKVGSYWYGKFSHSQQHYKWDIGVLKSKKWENYRKNCHKGSL